MYLYHTIPPFSNIPPVHVFRSVKCQPCIAISSTVRFSVYVRLMVHSTLSPSSLNRHDSVISPSVIPHSVTRSAFAETLIGWSCPDDDVQCASAVRTAVKMPAGANVFLLLTVSSVTLPPDV